MKTERKMSRQRADAVLSDGDWWDMLPEDWNETAAGKELEQAINVALECMDEVGEMRDLNSRFWEDDLR